MCVDPISFALVSSLVACTLRRSTLVVLLFFSRDTLSVRHFYAYSALRATSSAFRPLIRRRRQPSQSGAGVATSCAAPLCREHSARSFGDTKWLALLPHAHARSDIGFQLIYSQVEKRRGNGKVKGPSTCRCFNNGVFT